LRWDNTLGDIVATTASLVALFFVFQMWRMVKAPSRLILLLGMLYMVATRVVIFFAELSHHDFWLESHRSIVIVPQYILFAVAFGMTYYELKNFNFDVPMNAEDTDTEVKHQADMKERSQKGAP
jgi:hypothetical protein